MCDINCVSYLIEIPQLQNCVVFFLHYWNRDLKKSHTLIMETQLMGTRELLRKGGNGKDELIRDEWMQLGKRSRWWQMTKWLTAEEGSRMVGWGWNEKYTSGNETWTKQYLETRRNTNLTKQIQNAMKINEPKWQEMQGKKQITKT